MLKAAMRLMPPKITPVKCSHLYETPPWGYVDQPAFLNQVILAQTYLSAMDALAYLKNIEQKLGRKPNFRYGPRLIDLDILFFNDEIIQTESLTIPHPELINRAFVLIPLCEIAPDYVHPVGQRTMCELARQFENEKIKILPEIMEND